MFMSNQACSRGDGLVDVVAFVRSILSKAAIVGLPYFDPPESVELPETCGGVL